jgi:uncharacterized RDD family membrane protein YckC
MPCATHPDILTGLTTCARCGKEFCSDCIISLGGQEVCASCKQERVQDIKSGASSDLDLASRGARFGGMFVDGLVSLVVVLPLIFVAAYSLASHSSGVGSSIIGRNPAAATSSISYMQNIVPALLIMIYEGLMLSARGQTLGKMAFRIKVVRPDGSDISTGQAWGRAAARAVMNITQVLGFVDALMIFSKPRTCLHDRLAKTVVVNWKR